MGVPFLGAIPLDISVRMAGDDGTPVVLGAPDSAIAAAFRVLAGKVAQQASIAAVEKRQ
jgi:ATP-binding protein involved in chromosome partitioning